MTKYLDKVGLTEYTKLMKAHVAKSTLKLGESTGTAYDGAKGKANADFISGVKNGNLALVSPEIRGRWNVFNAAGTAVESMGSSSTSLSLENGIKHHGQAHSHIQQQRKARKFQQVYLVIGLHFQQQIHHLQHTQPQRR